MKLVLGLESLKGPLTGVGYYTFHLLSEISKADDVSLNGVLPGKLLDSKGVESLISQGVDKECGVAPLSLENKLKVFLRESPLAYNTVKTLRGYRVRRCLETLSAEFIYHEPNFVNLEFSGRSVITVHDLSHIRHPNFHPSSRVAYLSKNLPRAATRSDLILTVSQFTKEEMLSLGLVREPDKIVVTPLGYDPEFRPRCIRDTSEVLARYDIQFRRYILAVATLEPRKNIKRLLKAYSYLPASLKKDFPLVLVGAAGWSNEDLWKLVGHVRLENKVIVTGYLPRADVQKLMSASALFAYPSLYEGFGLPVLEAMASGAPVLTSNNSSLSEVAGDAAYTVDPEDMEEITVGLKEMITSEAARNEYRDRGIRRAQLFSWKDCAEKTISAYKALS